MTSSVQSLTLELASYASKSTLAYFDSLLKMAPSLTHLDIGPVFEREGQLDRLVECLSQCGGTLLSLRLDLSRSIIPAQDGVSHVHIYNQLLVSSWDVPDLRDPNRLPNGLAKH